MSKDTVVIRTTEVAIQLDPEKRFTLLWDSNA